MVLGVARGMGKGICVMRAWRLGGKNGTEGWVRGTRMCHCRIRGWNTAWFGCIHVASWSPNSLPRPIERPFDHVPSPSSSFVVPTSLPP